MTEYPERNPDSYEAQAGHEPSGVSVRGIITTTTAVALLVVLGLFVSRTLLNILIHEEQPPATTVTPPGGEMYYGPRLNPAQSRTLEVLTREKQRLLNSYSTVDQAGEIGRIPVERAADILAERGLDAFHELSATPQARPMDPPTNEQNEATP